MLIVGVSVITPTGRGCTLPGAGTGNAETNNK
jgi:hypothetical protein